MSAHSNPEFAIVADDLSGATDCAAAFTGAGRRLMVLLGDRDQSPGRSAIGADVIARSADSRDLEPGAAARATAATVEALLVHRPRRWFKKIDSTLRGHLAVELGVLLERLAPSATIVTPAFPATGRTLRGGRAYLHGEPLEQTATWRRPGHTEIAHLPQMLAAGGVSVVGIDHAELAAGQLACRVRSAPRDACVFVVDAQTDSDLDDLVAVASTGGPDILWVGSAGLAAALARQLSPTGQPRYPSNGRSVRRPGPVLVAVGSLAAPSRRQLSRLHEARGITPTLIAPLDLLGDDVRASQACEVAAARLRRTLSAGQDAAVAIASTHVATEVPGIGERLADRLGQLVAGVADQADGLVLTGGDTARATLTATGAQALRISGSVEPGVPISQVLPGTAFLVTKAGAFGDDDTLVRAVDILHQTHAALQEAPT